MELLTLREIAEQLKIPRTRLAYAAETYGIAPVRRAGLVKLYARADVPRLIAAVHRIADRRGGGAM